MRSNVLQMYSAHQPNVLEWLKVLISVAYGWLGSVRVTGAVNPNQLNSQRLLRYIDNLQV